MGALPTRLVAEIILINCDCSHGVLCPRNTAPFNEPVPLHSSRTIVHKQTRAARFHVYTALSKLRIQNHKNTKKSSTMDAQVQIFDKCNQKHRHGHLLYSLCVFIFCFCSENRKRCVVGVLFISSQSKM